MFRSSPAGTEFATRSSAASHAPALETAPELLQTILAWKAEDSIKGVRDEVSIIVDGIKSGVEKFTRKMVLPKIASAAWGERSARTAVLVKPG